MMKPLQYYTTMWNCIGLYRIVESQVYMAMLHHIAPTKLADTYIDQCQSLQGKPFEIDLEAF